MRESRGGGRRQRGGERETPSQQDHLWLLLLSPPPDVHLSFPLPPTHSWRTPCLDPSLPLDSPLPSAGLQFPLWRGRRWGGGSGPGQAHFKGPARKPAASSSLPPSQGRAPVRWGPAGSGAGRELGSKWASYRAPRRLMINCSPAGRLPRGKCQARSRAGRGGAGQEPLKNPEFPHFTAGPRGPWGSAQGVSIARATFQGTHGFKKKIQNINTTLKMILNVFGGNRHCK